MTALEEIKKGATQEEIAAAWSAWQSRHGGKLGPGPAFVEAINAALALRLPTLESLQRENEELRNLADRLKQEAQIHSMEARGANATVNEIYQIISGGKGEPANYHGAEPVREYVEAAKGEILRLETELALSKPIYSRRQIEARVKLLEEALMPFGHIGDDGRGSALPNDAPLAVVNANVPDLPQWLAKVRGVITQGDVRRARTALASTGGEHHAE